MPDNINFLIVDDMSYVSSLLLDHLKHLGFTNPIQKAVSVDGAISAIKKAHNSQNRINFVITDINMPDKSGIDLVKILRITPEYQSTPVVVVTGQENSEVVLKAIEAGANGYLYKPWTVQNLRKVIEDALEGQA